MGIGTLPAELATNTFARTLQEVDARAIGSAIGVTAIDTGLVKASQMFRDGASDYRAVADGLDAGSDVAAAMARARVRLQLGQSMLTVSSSLPGDPALAAAANQALTAWTELPKDIPSSAGIRDLMDQLDGIRAGLDEAIAKAPTFE